MVSLASPERTNHTATGFDRLRVGLNIILSLTQAATAPVLTALGIGIDIARRSAESPALFTPPTFTFAIWALIYPAMIAYAVYAALPRNLSNERLRQVGWWTAAAMLCNTLWPAVTVLYGVVFATVVLIFAMLLSLLGAFFALPPEDSVSRTQRVFAVFPISIFAAWITVAAIANTSSWLGNAGGFGGGPLTAAQWVALLSLVGGLAASAVVVRRGGNVFYTAVFVWALAGVTVKMFNLGQMLPAIAAIIAAAGVIGVFFYTMRKKTDNP